MSDFRAVAAMTQTLVNVLQAATQEFPGVRVLTDKPQRAMPEHKPGMINVFLYQVEPNASLRNAELPVRDADGRLLRLPQMALDLHYLISFYGDESQLLPQLLLGKTVSTLHAAPYPPPGALPGPPRDGDEGGVDRIYKLWESGLKDQVHLLRFVPINLNHDELSKLWTIFFQVPYTLSVVYRCSVLLIEPEGEVLQPASLPVREALVTDVTMELPEITQVVPQVLEARQGARIVLKGRNLDRATAVLAGGLEAGVRSAASSSLLVDLPAGLAAGVVTVKAVRDVELGRPPTPHRLYESNPASFVLRPRLTAPLALEDGGTRLVAELEPAVHPGQRIALLLNQLDGAAGRPPLGYNLAGPPGAHGERIELSVTGVEPGTYLARVAVGGVASALTVDPDPTSPTFEQYTGPRVVIDRGANAG